MSLFGRIRKRVRAAAARSRMEREMQEEMRAHIAQSAERFRARGMPDPDALAAARKEFGNLGVVQEEARDARSVQWIESALGDLRHATRQFARTPLTTATILLTLTLGIGVASASFASLRGIFSRPAPGVPDDPGLVTIRGINITNGLRNARSFSYPELMDYARLEAFAEVAGRTSSPVVVEMDGREGASALVDFVTPNFFRAIGLPIAIGRGFTQSRVDDHGTPELTAVIANAYARTSFGVAGSAVGKRIRVSGVNVTIVGVAPPRFTSPTGDGSHQQVWMPVSAWPLVDRLSGDAFTSRKTLRFETVARLREGASIEQVTPAVELIGARAAAALPSSQSDRAGRAPTFSADVVRLRGDVRVRSDRTEDIQMVGLVMGLVLVILLVCTTTVSSLLVGGAITRRREIAVRLALGASRGRIVRQLMTETALLALVAGAAGLVLYALIARSMHAGMINVNIDPTWGTALATVLFAIATTVMCGLSPALHATRDAVSGVLKDSSTTATVKSRLQRVFVVAQIALTQPLLIGLAMMMAIVAREGERLRAGTVGDRVILAVFDTWSAASRAENRMPALMARLAALPGVVAVLPQSNGYRILKMEAPATGASPARQLDIRTHDVPPGYFKAMEVPILRGRSFVAADTAAVATPIIIGSDLARQLFGDVDPIGKRLAKLTWEQARRDGEAEIVGVVAAADVGASEAGSQMRIFTPMESNKPGALLIRTEGFAQPMIGTIQAIARQEAPMMPAYSMKTLADIDRTRRSEVMQATTASAVGGMLTLLLASVGLYAVVALAVGQRRREIGIRISLGATPAQVVAMFFRSGLRVSVMGLAIGLPLSAAALKIISIQMGMPRTNIPVLAAAVTLAVVSVASLASWIPARRAAGVDPLVALRDA